MADNAYMPPTWSVGIFFTVVVSYILIPTYIANVPKRKVGINCTPHYLNMGAVLSFIILQQLLELGRFIQYENLKQYIVIAYAVASVGIICYTLKIGSIASQITKLRTANYDAFFSSRRLSFLNFIIKWLTDNGNNSLTQVFFFLMSFLVSVVSVYSKLESTNINDTMEFIDVARDILLSFVMVNGGGLTLITFAFASKYRYCRLYVIESLLITFLFWGLSIAFVVSVEVKPIFQMTPELAFYSLITTFNFFVIMTLLTPIIESKYQRYKRKSLRLYNVLFTSMYLLHNYEMDDEDDEESKNYLIKHEEAIEMEDDFNVDPVERKDLFSNWIDVFGFKRFIATYKKVISESHAFYPATDKKPSDEEIARCKENREKARKDLDIMFNIEKMAKEFNALVDCLPDCDFLLYFYLTLVACINSNSKSDTDKFLINLRYTFDMKEYSMFLPEPIRTQFYNLTDAKNQESYNPALALVIIKNYVELFIAVCVKNKRDAI